MRKALALFLFVPVMSAAGANPAQIRAAATKSVALIQKGTEGFYKLGTCFSCHDHGLPMMTFQAAREHGIPVDEGAAAAVAVKGLISSPNFTSIDQAVQDQNIIDPAPSEGWALVAAHYAGLKPNLVTRTYARRIATWQRPDGHWPTFDDRPPQSYSLFTATAVASQAMQLYLPSQLQKEKQERLARARKWFLTSAPQDTEDFTYRLYGLYWTSASKAEISHATHDLLALQRKDGGWGELPHLPSDAYSTGEALAALHEGGGISAENAAWQRGLAYLLSTQAEDGSWHVHTRMVSPAAISPPYFETGFPYGHDQMLSTDATCWAAMALMMALPEVSMPASPRPLTGLEPKGLQPWMETVLFGSASNLKASLEAGLDPNTKTEEGTTLLMMAANDPAKVKLLIDRGADVRAKAKSGYTALMVATTYFGTSESVKLLLDHGADAHGEKGAANDASPIFLAIFAGDTENMALLLAKGADANAKMNLLGMFPTSGLMAAVGFGDPSVVHALVAGGANVNDKDQDSMTPLHWAVLAHHSGAVRELIAGGADLNAADRYGYTPLLYAATVDFGDADTAKVLLQAGADPNIKAKKGETPISQAREFPYLRDVLERAGSRR
jgi:ankyrin repeat protein